MVSQDATEASHDKPLQCRGVRIDHQNLGVFRCQRQRRFSLSTLLHFGILYHSYDEIQQGVCGLWRVVHQAHLSIEGTRRTVSTPARENDND